MAVDGFVIDIVRGQQLIEIQTANFTAVKRKLSQLLGNHPVYLIYPVAEKKWIVRQTAVGEPIGRRKSPKRGRAIDIFKELVRIPHLLPQPNLTIGVLLTQQEEILRDDGRGSWRRKRWSIYDRRLLDVTAETTFNRPADFLQLLPDDLPQPFTNRQLCQQASITINLAQRITYTLRHCDVLEVVGKEGNALLYTFNQL
ncbi:MAG: hypothetical protein GY796_10465 [Chloroflexi bacterium]|nr:hypothetical protein [Chloroflexota bacterium]